MRVLQAAAHDTFAIGTGKRDLHFACILQTTSKRLLQPQIVFDNIKPNRIHLYASLA